MADDFWNTFDFEALDDNSSVETVAPNVSTKPEATPNLDDIGARIVKRAMVVFFIIDISGSMKGQRIGAVNDALRTLIPELKKREASNTNAEIKLAILEFSSRPSWKTIEPVNVSNYSFTDITDVYGGTNFGLAFDALNEKLSRSAFLKSSAGSYTPLIILLTDGQPSDLAIYPESLARLKNNAWFTHSTRAGIAIEEGAKLEKCKQVLLEFTGTEKMVLEATNTNMLAKQIELVTLTGVDFVTRQGSIQNQGGQPAGNGGFRTTMSPSPHISNPVPIDHTPTTQPSNPTTQPDDGGSTVIPGLDEIDWDKDFNI